MNAARTDATPRNRKIVLVTLKREDIFERIAKDIDAFIESGPDLEDQYLELDGLHVKALWRFREIQQQRWA